MGRFSRQSLRSAFSAGSSLSREGHSSSGWSRQSREGCLLRLCWGRSTLKQKLESLCLLTLPIWLVSCICLILEICKLAIACLLRSATGEQNILVHGSLSCREMLKKWASELACDHAYNNPIICELWSLCIKCHIPALQIYIDIPYEPN